MEASDQVGMSIQTHNGPLFSTIQLEVALQV